ncbi:TetR/AcrR family transcriptional regulator [Kordiimonas sp.]|uniref:TetR/AcrR family transcriptional regulator n=1 Tax=Kordiimonas sp. TaxID=1970157 RepID=UPI003A91D5C5
MPRIAKFTRPVMADKLTEVFKGFGYEGASLSMLAEAVELSKASLYHHFPGGKADIAAHVLAHSGAKLQRLVLSPLTGKGAGAERAHASLKGAALYYSGDVPICLMNSLLLGEGRSLFGAQIKGAVDAWAKGLAAAATDSGFSRRDGERWATEAIERIQGGLILCRVQGSRKPLEACLERLETELS